MRFLWTLVRGWGQRLQTSTEAKPVYGRLFQTPFADRIRNEVDIATMAVGNISTYDDINTIILAGRVQVNGRTVRELGTRVDPSRARITVDGERVGRPARRRYYVVHKPRGVVSTARDAHAARTVLELVPESGA